MTLVLISLFVALANGVCVSPVSSITSRSTAFPSGTPGRASCNGLTGLQNVTVRGGFVVELLCHNNVEYLVLPRVQSTSNFGSVQNLRTCVFFFSSVPSAQPHPCLHPARAQPLLCIANRSQHSAARRW
jgi:hypothetical protein